MIDVEELKEKYLNHEFDSKEFEIPPEKAVTFARLCGETESRFLDVNDPNFQAPDTYVASLKGRGIPKGFPKLGIGMDAGQAVEILSPIKPGTPITGKTHLHDIYTKTGRSGRMIFLVTRIEFYDGQGTHLANADSRIVIRERGES
ncbi:MAG: MaoC family dehydratase N-terminal domain-containing protein [Pseudomonadales bacterium]|nr:MaoC family dehydratase N-terminal domain-containing protein [Pseudomonadales bacterium]